MGSEMCIRDSIIMCSKNEGIFKGLHTASSFVRLTYMSLKTISNYPNAPCGASTAAPVFEDRRLVQLIAFCKSQMIDQSFDVCVFYLRLFFAYFCRYLYVLDVCCQFASCQAILAICKSYCKHVSEMHQQLCKNPLNIHAKSIPNQPKWCQGALRKRPWQQVCSRFPKKRHHL